ncbi:uncharacterized protein LOC127356667 isoform X2 [Dicentrarchus labrax]|uniref:uncharacterized protein LOC127356667 isoform X2 n=1 Tax=Dicentrarchus labrax TaxID=13489 RepID=UPI0021F660AB|nr:uncharacterized protein LOC127356667 isoform X2 [Dicentrarchus labrax]
MMVEVKQIQMSLFLIALLQFTAADLTVRDGDDVTLRCQDVIDGQQECGQTTWMFRKPNNTERTEAKSDSLSVTANCSLLIKKVTVEDAGLYICRQFISDQRKDFDLSVITMTDHEDTDEVTLSCSVLVYRRCTHAVTWMYEGRYLYEDNQEVKTSWSPCNVSVTFKTSHYIYTSHYNSLMCAVTDGFQKWQIPVRLPSGEQPGDEIKPTTTTTTAGTNSIPSPINETETELKARADCSVLNFVMLVMRVAELLLITVITVLLLRARGNQRPPDDSTVLNSGRSRAVRRSGPAASQVNNDEDEDDGVVKFENFGETSASVTIH